MDWYNFLKSMTLAEFDNLETQVRNENKRRL